MAANERVIVRLILGSYRHVVALSFAGLCAVSGCGNLIGLGGYSVADDGGDGGAGVRNVAGGDVGGGSAGASVAGSAGVEVGDGGTGGLPDESAGSAGEGGTPDSVGSGGTAATSGNGGANGSAGSGGACLGSCNDGNECTTDSCVSGACVHDPVAMGTTCAFSHSCDAQGHCVRCRDTAPGSGQDEGCTSAAPVCLGTGSDASCAGCSVPGDCNDGNDCTSETCTAGKCVFTTVTAGTACATGVCNGAVAAEKCVACADTGAGSAEDAGCAPAKPVCDASGTPTCYECNAAGDCATDNVSCTVETCVNHVCTHVATDSLCVPASSDVCKPNKCDATVPGGCKQVDISTQKTIIGLGSTQGNGGFESPAGSGAANWTDIGSFTMIYNCNASGSGCAGINGKTFTQASGGSYLAWLGGTTTASVTGVEQLIVLPAGTVKLSVMADTNFQTANATSSNKDFFEVRLLDAAHSQVGVALYAAGNQTAQTGTLRAWKVNDINVNVDVSAYAAAHPGADSYLTFWSSVDASLRTDFFIDNVRLTATVCQ